MHLSINTANINMAIPEDSFSAVKIKQLQYLYQKSDLSRLQSHCDCKKLKVWSRLVVVY